MLQTRLWMGSLLVLLTAGMLVVDQWLTPWFPFLFVFILGLALAACKELIGLLGSARRLHEPLLYVGAALLATASWWIYLPREYGWSANPLALLLGSFVALVLAVFLWEMATFAPPGAEPSGEGGSMERMARTIWALCYLGLLPSFL